MSSIGNKIGEARRRRGLSQEELAALARVNSRTVQRIENNENEPRGKTLQLLCEVLDLDIEALLDPGQTEPKKGLVATIVQGFFLVVLNLLLMAVFGFLTLDSEAGTNSRIGAILLSFFLPLFIVWKTPEVSGVQRFFQFGTGFLVYFLAVWWVHDFATGLTTGLFICFGIALSVLFYGDRLVPGAVRGLPTE